MIFQLFLFLGFFYESSYATRAQFSVRGSHVLATDPASTFYGLPPKRADLIPQKEKDAIKAALYTAGPRDYMKEYVVVMICSVRTPHFSLQEALQRYPKVRQIKSGKVDELWAKVNDIEAINEEGKVRLNQIYMDLMVVHAVLVPEYAPQTRDGDLPPETELNIARLRRLKIDTWNNFEIFLDYIQKCQKITKDIEALESLVVDLEGMMDTANDQSGTFEAHINRFNRNLLEFVRSPN
jgi:hypothetical protein